MPIQFHPKQGAILVCNFDPGFKQPEMVKRRPVVVISPQISARADLCTVVPISTEPPRKVMPYHYEIDVELPPPWEKGPNWVKGDMVYAVAFRRLELIRFGRAEDNRRTYILIQLQNRDLKEVRKCVLHALGFSSLTKHMF